MRPVSKVCQFSQYSMCMLNVHVYTKFFIIVATVNAGTCYVCNNTANTNCVWEGFNTTSMKPQECSDRYGGQCFKQAITTTIGTTSSMDGKA